jgi:fatty acid-binding protein 3
MNVIDTSVRVTGVGMVMRKLGASMKPTLTITRNGDTWNYKSESTAKKTEFDFKFGQEFDETTADGRKVKVSA